MSALIPIKEGQMNFVTPPSFVQLALELESPSKVSSIVDYLSDSLAALHLRMRSPSEFEFDRKHLIVHDLPKNSAKSLTDAAEYSGLHFTPNQDEAFASIAIHDNIVVLNASHRLCDGGFSNSSLATFLILQNYGKVTKIG